MEEKKKEKAWYLFKKGKLYLFCVDCNIFIFIIILLKKKKKGGVEGENILFPLLSLLPV